MWRIKHSLDVHAVHVQGRQLLVEQHGSNTCTRKVPAGEKGKEDQATLLLWSQRCCVTQPALTWALASLLSSLHFHTSTYSPTDQVAAPLSGTAQLVQMVNAFSSCYCGAVVLMQTGLPVCWVVCVATGRL